MPAHKAFLKGEDLPTWVLLGLMASTPGGFWYIHDTDCRSWCFWRSASVR